MLSTSYETNLNTSSPTLNNAIGQLFWSLAQHSARNRYQIKFSCALIFRALYWILINHRFCLAKHFKSNWCVLTPGFISLQLRLSNIKFEKHTTYSLQANYLPQDEKYPCRRFFSWSIRHDSKSGCSTRTSYWHWFSRKIRWVGKNVRITREHWRLPSAYWIRTFFKASINLFEQKSDDRERWNLCEDS